MDERLCLKVRGLKNFNKYDFSALKNTLSLTKIEVINMIDKAGFLLIILKRC